jgi:hypothetical protein
MKMEIEVETTGAYQLGFKHGLKEGVDMNAYENDLEKIWYRMGFDAGVAEYCRSDSLEDLDDDLDIYPHDYIR